MNEAIMIIAIVIFIGYWYVFLEKTNYNRAPKTIWTYWEDPDHLDPTKRMPDHSSWKQYNPDYEVIVLTKKTYQGYVTIPEEIRVHPALNPDHLRDLIKLWVLAERGGVWIDLGISLTKPLDLFPKYAEFSGFQSEGKIDPRFMACNKGSPFMIMWRDEFSEIARFPNVEKYVESKKTEIRDPITNVIQVACHMILRAYPTESLIVTMMSPS